VRFASVCSGIEAVSVAWSPLGWKAAFFSEIDKFPCAVLAHHYPDVPNSGDMNRFQDWPDANFDVLIGGTPCQSFSVAGLRKGLADPRGNLALVYLAIAARFRPRWLVWENVPGVLSSDSGRDFGAFLGGLGQLGYGWAYRVLDAQYVRVDGLERSVPQRRRRVFVVGYIGDWRRAAAVLFERESLFWDSAPRREARERVTHDVAPCIGASGRGFERTGDPRGQDAVIPILEAGARTGVSTDDPRAGIGIGNEGDPMFSLQAGKQHAIAFGGNRQSGPLDVATAVNAHGGPHGRLDFESETFVAFSCKDHGADAGETAPTLRAMGHDGSHANAGGQVAIAFGHQEDRNFSASTETFSALTRNQGLSVAKGWAVRRLTPLECERLMGFPDGYTAIPYRGKPAADGPRYKALGNSMAVNVVRWLGQRIYLVETAVQSNRAAA
jgi:DNA (cytosine-5)-methyltransferase 1